MHQLLILIRQQLSRFLFSAARLRSSSLTLVKPMRCLLFCLTLSAAWPVVAQGYPEKGRPIKIVVPSGPGSALDLLARAYAKAIGETQNLSAFVENKPGADGTVGIQSFLGSPTDGYTLLLGSSSWTVLNPIMMTKLPYDSQKDLLPLATISKTGMVMSIGGAAPFKTLHEFVKAARAQPGKYTCASASPSLRMACEYLQASAGIKLLVVPYKTTAAAMLAVASGEADAVFADASSSLTFWQTGRLKGVAFATPERTPAFPQIPVTREEGLPDFVMGVWYGFYFKAGTPPEVAATMRELLRKAAATAAVKDALKTFAHEPLDLTPAQMADLTRKETERWSKLVRDHKIKFND
ncbi:Tripartite tricarboxylate transporter family receptor [compost metagenome]